MKAFAIIPMVGGRPDLDPDVVSWHGYTLCAHIGHNWGCYLFSGTAAQLQAINALPHVYGICAVTESGAIRWAELDNPISPAVRTRLNTWLENRDYPTIPAGWTYRQVILAVYRRVNEWFDLDSVDVADTPE